MRLSAAAREAIAAEYVLGTLTGEARRRMKRLMMKDWYVRQAVWLWEVQLAPLLSELPRVKPSPSCLTRIEARLGFTSSPHTRVIARSRDFSGQVCAASQARPKRRLTPG